MDIPQERKLVTEVPGPKSTEWFARRTAAVPAGVANIHPVVTARASGAIIEDVDGNRLIDFATGIAVLNVGHAAPEVVAAAQRQLELDTHTCFHVTANEPYIELAERLNALAPIEGPAKTMFANSGAEAVENAVKIARSATGRPAVVVFDNAFHGRTLLTMTMTAKVKPYKAGFGPFAPEVYRAPVPYPFRGVTSDDAIAGLKRLFKAEVDPASVACVVLEPVQGEGGFIPMPDDFPRRLLEVCREHGILYVDDEVQSGVGRTGKMWAIEHYEEAAPDLLVSGKSIGGGLPLAAVTGPASIMDAVPAGGLGGTFGGNPLSCAAAVAVLDAVAEPEFLARASTLGETMRVRMEELASRHDAIGEVRGLGPMLAFELAEQSPDRASAVVSAAFERGLLLLSCGMYGNVIRLLAPLTIEQDVLDEGLAVLRESLAAAL
jgi:4-aminobutyrate aminotransferase/(S)-3-amino-2-methylpropionate transaminase